MPGLWPDAGFVTQRRAIVLAARISARREDALTTAKYIFVRLKPDTTSAGHYIYCCRAVMMRMWAAVMGDWTMSMPSVISDAPVAVPRMPVSTDCT